MPTIGSVSPYQNTRGDTVFDVWEWGGRPGDKTTGSVDRALEAIRKYVYNVRDVGVTFPAPVRIHFRAGADSWYLQRPCFIDREEWEISGEGCEQTVVEGLTQQPCFVFGLQRAVTDTTAVGYAGVPLTLSADHWVDLYGILDSSAVSAPRTRWGLRLKNDAVISCPLTPFSHGFSDGYKSIRQMTIDFAYNLNGNAMTSGMVFFGMGNPDGADGGAHPWYLKATGSTTIDFIFRTTGTNQPTTDQAIRINVGTVTGMVRVTFQIDLINATAQAFVNNVQVSVTNIPATFLAANNMSFVTNYYHPFNVGKLSVAVVYDPGVSFLSTPDITIYGLSVSADILYQNVGVGGAQAFTSTYSGVTFNDSNRYFNRMVLKRVAFLVLQDPPPGNPACYNDGRVLSIKGGQSADTHGYSTSSCGYFLTRTNLATPFFCQRNRIRDISVINGNPTQSGTNGTPAGGWLGSFGHAIALGSVYDMQIDNVYAKSRGQAIGSLNTGANYTITLNNVALSGGDAGYYAYNQIVNINNYRAEVVGRTAIRVASCSLKVVDIFFGGSQSNTDAGIWIHRGLYGGAHHLENLEYDNEGKKGPAVAAIVCEGYGFTPSFLRIVDLRIGTLKPEAVGVKLVDGVTGTTYLTQYDGVATRTCIIDGMTSFGAGYTAQVQTDGTLWQGEIRNFQQAYGGYDHLEDIPMISNTGTGGLGRMVSRHKDYCMPPRGGTWLKNCHVLEVQLPNAGQYATIRCIRSGTYGTSVPPIWCGSEVQDDGTSATAAYIVDHVYIPQVTLA